MFYGYALYYKDQDGYEIPLLHRNAEPAELVLVTASKKIADKWFDEENKALYDELNPKITVVTKGFWIWKKKMTYPGRYLANAEYRFKVQVYNTLFVKRVKLV